MKYVCEYCKTEYTSIQEACTCEEKCAARLKNRQEVELTEFTLYWKYNPELDRIETEYLDCGTDGYIQETPNGYVIYPYAESEDTYGAYAQPNTPVIEEDECEGFYVRYIQTDDDNKTEAEIKQLLRARLKEELCKVHNALGKWIEK